MSDDTLAFRTLLSAISDLRPGVKVHADTVREAFDAAGLTSAERSGAFTRACNQGYLNAITMLLDDGITLASVQVRSTHEGRKSGWSLLYRRTTLPVPKHLCELNVVGAQWETRYDGGSKTAPGVASTNTESLAHSEAAKPHGRTCIT